MLSNRPGSRIARQVWQMVVVVVAVVVLVVVIPVGDSTQGQLLSLLGIVFTGVIGLASTSFVSNAMAGFMLRSVASFHGGDFIRVGEFFGRVTETALFHTEIQNQDRDLVTMLNLYLITHPVEVVRANGTLISADVSLGYDVHRRRIRDLLVQAADDADLTDAFVQITELGDYSVNYRVSGFLHDVSNLLSKQTALRANILDHLHGDGIEIVSPSFMNQRPVSPEEPVIPKQARHGDDEDHNGRPEQLMFDKAEIAGRIKKIEDERAKLANEIETLAAEPDTGDFEIAWRKRQLASLDEILESLSGPLDNA
jgi:small-conductance mechanosensitive channel